MRDSDDQQDESDGESSEPATEAEVSCPYCGEMVTLTLDPAGGMAQEYIEDCQVCCRPWRVQVSYGEEGAVDVVIEPAE
jgi:cysteine-rich CPXCG protein